MKQRLNNRKAIYFTLDALLATFLLVGGLLLLSQYITKESSNEQLEVMSRDLLESLSNIKIYQINHPFIAEQIANGNITNYNNSVMFQIGEYWAANKSEEATNLSKIFVEGLVPNHYGIIIRMEDEIIYSRNISGKRDSVNSKRMMSGIAKGKAVKGSSSSAYLRKIQNKKSYAYIHYGGFVGQGNITSFLEPLPSDVNSSDILEMVMELDAPQSFKLYINGAQCGGIYTPVETNMTPDWWNITSCTNSIQTGLNNFTVIFENNINKSYIAGGFIRAQYQTDEFASNASYGVKYYNFSAVYGVANLYDSFYIPGTLHNMTVFLHFKGIENDTVLLSIGEKAVYENNATGADETLTINDNELKSAPLNLDYLRYGNTTVPLRFGAFELFQQVVTGGNADVVLITDFSGSMKKAVSDWSQGNAGGDCVTALGSSKIRRTEVAQCLDNMLVDIVMNYSGNRIWPVFIHDDKIKWYDNPNDKDAIKGYISSWPQGKGKTCIACALNRAYEIFNTYTTPDRETFIVLMTDGTPTHCADDGCLGTSDEYGDEKCAGLCDTSGACDVGDIPGQCNQCTINNEPQINAYFSANRSVEDFNATIFTIGFGPLDDCPIGMTTMQNLADIGNGTFQQSNNTLELIDIYRNISYEILNTITLSIQNIDVSGDVGNSNLYSDSYIKFVYEPIVAPVQPNEISFVLQTPHFGTCNPSVDFYPGMRVAEAKMTSYSGVHWTDTLISNGRTVYNLSNFYVPYPRLGDPFLVQIPTDSLVSGVNNFYIQTADNASNLTTDCSMNNSIIYTAYVNSTTARTDVKEFADGCNWTIEFEDGTSITDAIPSTYDGDNNCTYTAASISYNPDDAYDASVYAILRQLDFDKDGRVFVNLDAVDLEVIVTVISQVPYLWGPTMFEIEVWR